jgi:hypothetical protein
MVPSDLLPGAVSVSSSLIWTSYHVHPDQHKLLVFKSTWVTKHPGVMVLWLKCLEMLINIIPLCEAETLC